MEKVKGKHLDKYSDLAKKHGYRSRTAWKLVQLDSKFNFLRSSRSVLDLCAAPGGWMQVAVDRVPVGSLVIGVDLDRIRPVPGAIAVQEDITKCKATVKRLMAEHSGSGHGSKVFDLILNEGASESCLVIDAVRLVAEFLAPKGTFVTKVFKFTQEYSAVLYCLKQHFEKVEVDKPLASSTLSAEIYVIGLKYKAPDPGLLDIEHLFEAIKVKDPACHEDENDVHSTDDQQDEDNPLLVPIEEDWPTRKEINERWFKFNQDVFAKPEQKKNLVKSDSEDEQKKNLVKSDSEDEQLSDEYYEQFLRVREESIKQRKGARESNDNELLNGADDENDVHSVQGSDNNQQDEVNQSSRGAKKDEGKGRKGNPKGNTSAKMQGKFNEKGSKQGKRSKVMLGG